MKRLRRNNVGRRLVVETLDQRRLMAGDLTVTFVNGTLTVEESAGAANRGQGNGVRVETANGLVEVTGLNVNGSATTLNGQAGPLTFNGAIHNLNVDVNGGHDHVELGNISIVDDPNAVGTRGDLVVQSGDGNDVVIASGVVVDRKGKFTDTNGRNSLQIMGNSYFGRLADQAAASLDDTQQDLVIVGGRGKDTIQITNTIIGDDFNFRDNRGGTATGGGVDLSLTNVEIHALHGERNNAQQIDALYGTTAVTLRNVTTTRGAALNNQPFHNLKINMGGVSARLDIVDSDIGERNVDVNMLAAATSTVVVDNASFTRLFIDTAAGDDTIFVLNCFEESLGQGIQINSGDGLDRIAVNDYDGWDIRLNTFDGNDKVRIRDSYALGGIIRMGDGDDDILVENKTAGRWQLYGGAGFDRAYVTHVPPHNLDMTELYQFEDGLVV